MPVFSLFSAAYRAARRMGLLRTRPGSSLFIASYFAYKRHLEDPFDKLSRHPHWFRGGHLIDAGANIGYCSALFSRLIDPEYKVFAFEPEAENFALLQRVIRKQTRSTVHATQAALGAFNGQIGLCLNPKHHGDHRVSETGPADQMVPLISLDTFLEERGAMTPVRLIKIDVQGYELAVCRGAVRTLERNPDCIVVLEYMPEALKALGVDPPELLAWFGQRGYQVDTLRRDGHISAGFSGEIPARGYVDLVFSRSGQLA
ncbi:MAG: FkbM family methyltransferase [Bryobacterales bacterium]|nr:FkbM family methyltransferase [Bryobacterales bacterium]